MNRTKMSKYLLVIILLVGAVIFMLQPFGKPRSASLVSANLMEGSQDISGFARADGPYSWRFPQDFGPHPEYQTEWWYYTGNLEAEDGRKFGYQLTFFRRALTPQQEQRDRQSDWGSNQIYMGHLAISDIAANDHYSFEKFSRGVEGLAGAKAEPFAVWLENWEVGQLESGEFYLTAEQEGLKIALTMTDQKGPVLQGIDGYSQKGSDSGNASYYFSQTRLASSGEITISGTTFEVQGLSWMDHEFSTSALSEGQVGWDWFSIQLEGGLDLMVFQIRRADGSIDPYSSGTIIDPEGRTISLANDDFKILPTDTWRSPQSGAEYPSSWSINIPEFDISLEVTPLMANQEMNVSFTYWEGAVGVQGEVNGEIVAGQGYVELTGYAASMEGQF